jgi:hypothetical protein
MAGEWIAYDLGLPDKPEVQELIDVTGLPVSEIVFSLLRLWGWAAMHTADGRARMTVPRLVRTCGQDQQFWFAVAAVGWLVIDETDATVAIPGWDRRFSQAAKSRLQQADRSAASESRRSRAGSPGAQAPEPPTPSRGRGDRGHRGEVPPPPREAAPWKPESPEELWKAFRASWNTNAAANNRREWKPSTPPDGWSERLAEAGWWHKAEDAAKRLPSCKYFQTPVTLVQFLGPRFVDLCLGGQYDTPKAAKGGREPDKPAPTAWSGDDAERFEATRRKLLESLTRDGG